MPVFLQHGSADMIDVWSLFEYVAYAVGEHRKPDVGDQYCPRISCGFELDTTNSVIASALKGAARSRADAENQATVRRPISWIMTLAGEALMPSCRVGGRVVLLALCALFCFLARASEILGKYTNRIVCGGAT